MLLPQEPPIITHGGPLVRLHVASPGTFMLLFLHEVFFFFMAMLFVFFFLSLFKGKAF